MSEKSGGRAATGWKIPSKYFLPGAAVRHGPLSFETFRTKGEVLRET